MLLARGIIWLPYSFDFVDININLFGFFIYLYKRK